jgi:uncharacterized protein DUF1749
MLHTIPGKLFLYDAEKRLCAFLSGPGNGEAAVALVLIPGLTDGLLALPYTKTLADGVTNAGCSHRYPRTYT